MVKYLVISKLSRQLCRQVSRHLKNISLCDQVLRHLKIMWSNITLSENYSCNYLVMYLVMWASRQVVMTLQGHGSYHSTTTILPVKLLVSVYFASCPVCFATLSLIRKLSNFRESKQSKVLINYFFPFTLTVFCTLHDGCATTTK